MLSSGPQGDWYFLKLIEPQAATFLPASLEQLTAQESALLSYLNPEQRTNSQTAVDKWKSSEGEKQQGKPSDSGIESLLKRADDLSDPNQKDQLYYRAALKAVGEKKSKLALEIADKLSSSSADSAKQLIAFGVAYAEVNEHQFEEAEELAKRDSDLARRAYVLNLIASSLTSDKHGIEQANVLISEVQDIARRIDSNQEKVSTLIGSASAFRSCRASSKIVSSSWRHIVGRLVPSNFTISPVMPIRADMSGTSRNS